MSKPDQSKKPRLDQFHWRHWDNWEPKIHKLAWVLAAYIVAGSAVYVWNEQIFFSINGFQPELFQWLMMLFSVLADGSFVFMIGAVFYRRKKGYFWALIAAVLVSGAVVQFIKFFYPAPRPFKFFDGGIFTMGEKLYTRSFPSGHTTAAFALARYLQAGETRKWQVAALVFAALAGVSRIYVGVHFPFDVYIGAGFGYAVCHLFIRAAEKRRAFANRPEYRYAPAVIYGIGLTAGAVFLVYTCDHYWPLQLEGAWLAGALSLVLAFSLIREIIRK